MVLVDMVFMGGYKYLPAFRDQAVKPPPSAPIGLKIEESLVPASEEKSPAFPWDIFENLPQATPVPKEEKHSEEKPVQRKPRPIDAPKEFMKAPPAPEGPPKLVIIIDDMGMNHRNTEAMIALPGSLTLAFLPYAPHVETMTKEALDHGHELLIHTPMEPINPDLDIGPIGLTTSMTDAEFDAELNKIFNAFKGYIGINNHMGSRLTQDAGLMRRVMAKLRARDLIFIDSKTISTSVADDEAANAGVRHASRDVFLDNIDDKNYVLHHLLELEKVAMRRGYAIAIGHPRNGTVEALKEWLPGVEKRGFKIVPVSAVVHREKPQAETVAAPVSLNFGPYVPRIAPLPPPQ